MITRVKNAVDRLQQWWQRTRMQRSLARYNNAAGGLLSGGIAYTAVFSVFAALVIGYTVLMVTIGNDEHIRQQITDVIDSFVPGLVDTGEGGILTPDQLVMKSASWSASIIAGLVLLWSALALMSGLRAAVRTIFGTQENAENPVIAKLKDLGAFAILLVAVALTSIVTTVIQTAGDWVSTLIGQRWLTVVSVVLAGVVVIAIDMLVFSYVVRVLGRFRTSHREVIWAGAAVAIVVEILRVAGTQIVTQSAQKNALLASFAVLVSLLLVVNLIARISLQACAWLAEGASAVTHHEVTADTTELNSKRANSGRQRSASTTEQSQS